MSNTATITRFYIYTLALLPFILLLATGIILLKYHTGAPPDSTVMGHNADFWFTSHKVTSVLSLILILLHLFVKTSWVKQLFTFRLKGAFKVSNTILFVVFALCTLTAFLAWLVYGDSDIAHLLDGIHNKLGLVLIIVFLIHLWNYRKVILNQFKKFSN